MLYVRSKGQFQGQKQNKKIQQIQMRTNVIPRFCVFLTGQSISSNIFIIQVIIQSQMLILKSSKLNYDF